jgi:predicted patatin/cPLA2 family phospholipase
MSKVVAFAILCLMPLLVGGCAIKPENIGSCNIIRRGLTVSDPVFTMPGAPVAEQGTLARAMADAVNTRSARLLETDDDATLFMSGGSQNGAFGAGILKGWQDKNKGKLPAFAVVTGVSTGAILSTFAFVGDAKAAVDGYSITHESELLHANIKSKGKGLGFGAVSALLRKGAIADLKPLRERMATALTPAVLTAVAEGQDAGRKLFIGVVDVDSGEAVAFDMTELAARWREAEEGSNDRTRIKGCYIEAVLASSSVPMAAPPVFIDNRMYVDGGARFGVFSDEIGKTIQDRAASGALMDVATTYVIVNGTQKIEGLCPWATCPASNPAPPTLSDKPHRTWNFVDLALRSEGILVNQIYRFSADKIKTRADAQGRLFQFFKIDDDAESFPIAFTDVPKAGTLSCAKWRQYDTDTLHPIQFYPHFMRCLTAYGVDRASKHKWRDTE